MRCACWTGSRASVEAPEDIRDDEDWYIAQNQCRSEVIHRHKNWTLNLATTLDEDSKPGVPGHEA